MRTKQTICHITDLLMVIMLMILMAYVLTGQEIHKWMGVAAFTLFVLHHVLNWRWFGALGKGKYTPFRIIQTILVVILLVNMLLEIVSGIAMARYALTFLDFPIPVSLTRRIHLCCGYWSFILSAIHLGLHWNIFLRSRCKLQSREPLNQKWIHIMRLLAAGTATYGLVCFIRQDIISYLFMRTEFVFFDYEKATVLVVVEFFAIFVLWVLAEYLLWRAAVSLGKRKVAKLRKPANSH